MFFFQETRKPSLEVALITSVTYLVNREF